MANLSLIYCFVFVCASFLSAVFGQDEPQITKIILPEIKRAGENGQLNCTVTRQNDNKVYWIHKASQMVISSDDKIELESLFNPNIDGFPKYEVIKTTYDLGDLNTYTLIVRRLQLTDAGWYTCQVVFKGASSNPEKDGEMVVLLPPTIIYSQTTQTATVKEGTASVNLTCDANGYPPPRIVWVRPNGQGLPLPGNPFTFQSKKLTVRDVKKEDRGVYRCIADNDVRPAASYDATLYVEFKPYAEPVQTTYGQAQNRLFDVLLECRIAGLPTPDLKWYQIEGNGMDPIKNDDKHQINTIISYGQELSISEVWFQLRIINVQANDYGEYYCEGTSIHGHNGARVLLYETSECQGPNCPQEDSGISGGADVINMSAALLLFVSMATVWMHL